METANKYAATELRRASPTDLALSSPTDLAPPAPTDLAPPAPPAAPIKKRRTAAPKVKTIIPAFGYKGILTGKTLRCDPPYKNGGSSGKVFSSVDYDLCGPDSEDDY